MKLEIPAGVSSNGFKVWEFRVSHNQLLLRRPKASEASTNVDVMFYNVEYMDLPSVFFDLEFAQPNEEDIAFAKTRCGEAVNIDRVFVLKNGVHRHIVIAGGAVISESTMGIFESPFALPPVKA